MYSRITLFSYIFVLLFCFPIHAKQTSTPIVLVHGFSGWGRDEMSFLHYWGGPNSKNDIAEDLQRQGATVFTAAVGPFSSNWDRATELYYQIKGGCVDYGKEHSEKFKHARFGKCFKGFYPEWNADHPVHLIGHSMGGQTVRTLVQLLENKKPHGNAQWIRSVTTVSSPHKGATLPNKSIIKAWAKNFILTIATLAQGEIGSEDDPIYDAKLDQWDLYRKNNEPWLSYVDRVFNAPIWEDNNDFSIYDISQKGAEELNTWVKTHPKVYYFSISNTSTYHDALNIVHARPDTNPLLLAFSEWMAKTESPKWKNNDGACNTVSMLNPTGQPMKEYTGGHPQKGIWNHILHLKDWDHLDVVGFCETCNHLGIYQKHWQLLRSLEK